MITITCKDQRVIKFKFENAPGDFLSVLNKIKQHSVVTKPNDLFCYTSNQGYFTHRKVGEAVMADFARLGIPKGY